MTSGIVVFARFICSRVISNPNFIAVTSWTRSKGESANSVFVTIYMHYISSYMTISLDKINELFLQNHGPDDSMGKNCDRLCQGMHSGGNGIWSLVAPQLCGS